MTKVAIVIGDATALSPEPISGLTVSQIVANSIAVDPVQVIGVDVGYLNQNGALGQIAAGTGGSIVPSSSDLTTTISEILNQTVNQPFAWMGQAYSGEIGQPVQFDASGSYDPSGTSLTLYEWDFDGDGVFDLETTVPTATHIYDADFNNYVVVRVTGVGGTALASARTVVNVEGYALQGDEEPCELDENGYSIIFDEEAGRFLLCTATNLPDEEPADGPGSISGLVWEDSNGNNLPDMAELGFNQVLVNLFKDDGDGFFEPHADDLLELSATTGSLGAYGFDDLTPGQYWVDPNESSLPTGYKANIKSGLQLVSIGAGQAYTVNFGYQSLGAPICVTVQQRDGEAKTVADAIIASQLPNTNDGTIDRLYVGGDANGEQQSLIRFDLEFIPPNVVIDAATYEMYMLTTGPGTVRLHQVNENWEETAVTWNNFNQNYQQHTEGFFAYDNIGTHAVDLTNIVQNWVSGAEQNYGLLLEQNIGSLDYGKSSEYTYEPTRPVLNICYHVESNTLPSPWTSADIGNVDLPGASHFANDLFTIQASGNQIWGQSDGFHFTYQPLTGDGTITGYVDKPLEAGGWTFSGLMIRESLDDNSRHMMLRVHPTGELWSAKRAHTGLNTSQWKVGIWNDGQWVRLTRVGDTISTYHSVDGQNWEFVDTKTFNDLSSEVYFGLAVTSYDNSQFTVSQFEDVTVTPAAPVVP